MEQEFLFVEKYRPRTVSDTILPKETKLAFQSYVDQRNIPNLLLSGGPGIGKTTVARAMLEELGCDYIIINGSMNGNIDTLRNDIQQFASSVSLSGGRKYVILDESDFLNPHSFQPSLRNFMEEYSRNCGFILTCNYKNKILDAIHSRCGVIDFNIPSDEKAKLAAEMFKRACYILTQENVEFDKKVVAEVVKKYFPDNRRVLNELQRYSVNGSIDSGILAKKTNQSLNELFKFITEKNFTSVRKWVGENSDMDATEFFSSLYRELTPKLENASIPQLVLILADYQYKQAFIVDSEINISACIAEIMSSCRMKT